MLSPYRVLDLTDHRGQLGGHILRMLGAEVILVEPPGGSPARHVGPFAGEEPGPELSLTFWAHNRGKRSVVLDLDTAEDRDRFLELVAGADVLIENEPPGAMAARSLDHETLVAANGALVHVSITPFGSFGPKAQWASTDLTLQAASGCLSLTGDKDRPPLRLAPAPQAWYHAAAEGAQAALVALYERERSSGRGQHADVSVQQAANQIAASQMLTSALGSTRTERIAGGVLYGGIDIKLMWPCADGYVSVTFLFGAAIGPFTRRLMEWVCEEGFCDQATRDKDWINYAVMLLDGREPVAEYERVRDDVLVRFFASKTKAELLAGAVERRVLIAPVATMADVAASPQLAERGYWDDVDMGPMGTVRFPGAMARLSATPLAALPRPPRLGEHTDEVLGTRREPPRQAVQVREGDPRHGGNSANGEGQALAGLKVLDLMWVMAGPAASRVLADYGADVIRVESIHRIDTARTLAPFVDNDGHPEQSGLFNNLNGNKRGMALDLSHPLSHSVMTDLVQWADVVLDAFSPRGMRSLGLSHEILLRRRPGLVVGSTCLNGQSGPLSSLAGFGTMAAAMSGFFHVCGWTDRPPCGPFGAYTDYVSPRYFLCTVLAALDHQRRTGKGQYIDFSQSEASIHNLSPILLDQIVNGRVAEWLGNDDALMVPHGVYPSEINRATAPGDQHEAWVAIACETDEQWRALCGVVDGSLRVLAGLERPERRARRREIDGLLTTWTATRPADEATQVLQAVGVPAHTVATSAEVLADPQLAHRCHHVEMPHGRLGSTWIEGSRFRLSRTPAVMRRAGPTLGQDTFEILAGTLGYDAEWIAELAAEEIFE